MLQHASTLNILMKIFMFLQSNLYMYSLLVTDLHRANMLFIFIDTFPHDFPKKC